MNTLLFFISALLVIWALFFKEEKVNLGPGVMAAQTPIQEKPSSSKSFPFKGYTITPLASFEISAKVLGRENYRLGREADLSPTDLALGWGKMSDEAVLKYIDISQSNRWYRWQTKAFPLPRREIEINSANMHMIPKDTLVESTLERVRKGDIVSLKGELVRVNAADGWSWVSSLSRKDTGGGACEVVFVEAMKIKDVH